MKVILLFSQKGGSGKSTAAIHLAAAAGASVRVLLVDADPQGTALAWSRERGRTAPKVVQGDAASMHGLLDAAARSGIELAIVDCPPHAMAGTASLLRFADLVLLPTQPSMPDLVATKRSVALVQAAGKSFAFVISRAPARAPEVLQAQEALACAGDVCPVVIGDRRAFSRALTDGHAVTELTHGQSRAAEEVQALWQWVQQELDRLEERWAQAA